jgi:hypothetical protein
MTVGVMALFSEVMEMVTEVVVTVTVVMVEEMEVVTVTHRGLLTCPMR